MCARELAARRATAQQVVAALEAYEHDVHRLVARWLDMDLYQNVSGQIDHIRLKCAALPELSLAWVGVLVTHAELIHCLWRSSQPGQRQAAGDVKLRLQEHLASVATLAGKCRELASAGDTPACLPWS